LTTAADVSMFFETFGSLAVWYVQTVWPVAAS
jgi:hypothetical protein